MLKSLQVNDCSQVKLRKNDFVCGKCDQKERSGLWMCLEVNLSFGIIDHLLIAVYRRAVMQ